MKATLALFALPLAWAAGSSPFAVPPIGWLREQTLQAQKVESDYSQSITRRANTPKAQFFQIPVDHFPDDPAYAPHSTAKFGNRYWFDATYYKPGGPVIILQGGETSGADRIPFLQTGIVQQLAQATNGLGVIFEHRYYGNSFPTPDLSVENLRFLTTDQAMADMVYFAENIKFPGLEQHNLTAGHTAWIAYGGSYAGGLVAFLRKLYPSTYFGAISSSGVTEAREDYWQYYEPIKKYAPHDCVNTTQHLINIIDRLALGRPGSDYAKQIKAAFGFTTLPHFRDFTNALTYGIGGWQSLNWDPAESDPTYYEYCAAIVQDSVDYPTSKNLTKQVTSWIQTAGYSTDPWLNRMLNMIGWVDKNLVRAVERAGYTLPEYYGTHNQSFYDQDDKAQYAWRSWPWQWCNQWGYLQTGSGVPSNQLPLISRTITLEYTKVICRDAFNISGPPDTKAINQYGGQDFSYDRVALIGGQWDPWRDVTPLAPAAKPWGKSTTEQPIILIPDAIHHWDENGVPRSQYNATFPPQGIKSAQSAEATFVKAWLKEFKPREAEV